MILDLKRRSLLFAVLFAACNQSHSQVPNPADAKAEEALVASAWSGQILGLAVEMYLLDQGMLVLRSGEQKPATARWHISGGRFSTGTVKLSELYVVILRADVRGETLAGATDDLMGKTSTFELRRDVKPSAQLLAATPPGRPYPAPPPPNPKDFQGVFELIVPERIEPRTPLIKARLNCTDEKCSFSMGSTPDVWDKLDPVRPSNFYQARSALKYARERKDRGKQENPYLAPLLDSQADISSCLNLGNRTPKFPGADMPGLTILCTLDHNPWDRPVVLLMGSILANCGPSFCRYALMPLLRQQ